MNSKAKEELIKIIKKLEGTLLIVAVEDDSIKKEILKNININKSYNLNKRKNIKKNNNEEIVSINKVSKKIKFKFDYMICDLNGINIYLWKTVKQSYKLINDKIYFYGISDDYEIEKLANRYKRYNCIDKIIKDNDNYLVIIDVSKIKVKFISKVINNIKDLLLDINDAIGNGLMQ